MAPPLSVRVTIEPFEVRVADDQLAELRARLRSARWPDQETAVGWEQGVPLSQLRKLCEYWQRHYDWRRCESQLNRLGQARALIDGLGVHFLHIRSPCADALPLVLTHGWPGSVLEFVKAIGPLTDPVAHGGKETDAFHLIIPSLPGFGFSDRPPGFGWNLERIGAAWIALMDGLGYRKYVAQGGDWGAGVTIEMAALAPPGLLGVHINFPIGQPSEEELAQASIEEKAVLEERARWLATDSGYALLQSTRPQTVGYGLADSPVFQAAWIYEKFRSWADCAGDPANLFSADELLDNITLYWLTNTGASSARLYWESLRYSPRPIRVRVGVTLFPKEIYRLPRRCMQRIYPTLEYWGEVDRGGHFAAFEVPDVFVNEVRNCFRPLRGHV